MKRKHIIILLLVLGLALVFIPLALAYVATINTTTTIIGGAGWPTFKLIFSRSFNGLYRLLTFLGVLSIIAAIFIGTPKKK